MLLSIPFCLGVCLWVDEGATCKQFAGGIGQYIKLQAAVFVMEILLPS